MTRNSEVPGFFRRIAAFALDYLIIAAYLIFLAAFGAFLTWGPLKGGWEALTSSPLRMDLLAFVTAVLPVILYFTISESSKSGATWGKRRMGLRVVHISGDRLSCGRAALRSVIKFLPWQIAHTSLVNIPGWPMAPQALPRIVIMGLILAWTLVVFYILTLAAGQNRRTPYDWIAGSRVVRGKTPESRTK
jgi:uncharacterized RDD family membrane protein YckC